MSSRRARWLTPVLCLLVGCFALFFVSVALFAVATASAGAGLQNGRSLTVNAKSWYLALESDGQRAVARTAGRRIEIDGDVVSVDGKRIGEMDAAAKNVVVSVGLTEITFVADGSPFASCPR